MAEIIKSKTLNTILRLKYDTLANWKAAEEYVPMKGEVCIVSVPADTQQVASEPAILFKVGDGIGVVFKKEGSDKIELPWASGLAADVHAWAKESSLTVTKNGTGNVVASISWDATLNNGKGGIKYETAAVATAEGLDQIQKDLSALTTKVNAMYTNDQINTAIATAKSEAETTAANALSAARTEISSEIDADVKVVADDLAKYKTTVNEALDLKADKSVVEAMYTNETIDSKISTAKTEAISAAKTELDGITLAIEKYNEVESIVIKDSEGAVIADVSAATFVKDGMLTNAVYNAETNKITLTWNTDAGKTDTEIDLTDLVDTYTGGNGISVSNSGEISIDDNVVVTHTDLNSTVNTLVGTVDDTADTASITGAKKYTDAAIVGLDSSVQATATVDNTVNVLTGVTQEDGKLTGKNEVTLAAIAKTGNVNDLVQTEGDVLVLFGGNAAGWTE